MRKFRIEVELETEEFSSRSTLMIQLFNAIKSLFFYSCNITKIEVIEQ